MFITVYPTSRRAKHFKRDRMPIARSTSGWREPFRASQTGASATGYEIQTRAFGKFHPPLTARPGSSSLTSHAMATTNATITSTNGQAIRRMRFAFSTVGCPKWDFATICARAKEYGYEGVEVRGFLNESMLTAANVFHTDPGKVRSMFAFHGVAIACLASSVAMT